MRWGSGDRPAMQPDVKMVGGEAWVEGQDVVVEMSYEALPPIPDFDASAITLDRLKQQKPALEAYRQFLAVAGGKFPDQEFQSRQRARILEKELSRK